MKYSPNFLFFGRELNIANSIFNDYSVPSEFFDTEHRILSTVLHLRQALSWAQENNAAKLKSAKIYYD